MQDESTTIIIFLIGGTAGMLILAGAVIFFVLLYQRRMLENKLKVQNLETDYQKQLLATTIESQESERNRVGSELHDSVGAMLSTIRLNLKMAAANPDQLEEVATELTTYLDETIETVRTISRDLYPAGLKNFGLTGVIKELVERINAANKIKTKFTENGEITRLSEKQELMIYRILQEVLNNAIKHSRAHHLNVHFEWENNLLTAKVSDDGIGFTTEQLDPAKRGIGLYNISNRAEMIGAEVKFGNLENSGASIILTVPYGNSQNETEQENQSPGNG